MKKIDDDIDWIDLDSDEKQHKKKVAKAAPANSKSNKKDSPAKSAHSENAVSKKHGKNKKKFEDVYEDDYDAYDDDYDSDYEDYEDDYDGNKKSFRFNMHYIFLGLIAVILLIVIVKLVIWNIGEKDTSPDADNEAFNTESMDNIVPLDSSNTDAPNVDDDLNILFLGNGQLAEDKDSENNLANIIKRKTGANIYNCAIEGSYMAMKNETYKNSFPYDGLSFYNLCTMFTVDNKKLGDWVKRDYKETQGTDIPEDAAYAIDTLRTIDYDELDVLCIYYDFHDYLDQHLPYNDDNKSDVNTYAGALEAGLLLVKEAHPNVRIIVLSPTFIYVENEKGEYQSCYDQDVLPWQLYVYVIHEQDTCYLNNVTFVDNFYGSIYGEIADRYLEDGDHINQEGLELLADRFAYALNRFNEYKFPDVEVEK